MRMQTIFDLIVNLQAVLIQIVCDHFLYFILILNSIGATYRARDQKYKPYLLQEDNDWMAVIFERSAIICLCHFCHNGYNSRLDQKEEENVRVSGRGRGPERLPSQVMWTRIV